MGAATPLPRDAPEIAWPNVNDHVDIHHEAWADWLPSRVEDVAGRRLSVAAPLAPAVGALSAEPDDPVSLRWIARLGVALLEGRVVDTASFARPTLPLWRIDVDSEPRLVQRREYARVPVVLPVVAVAGGEVMSLTSLDLAEAGMRCVGRGRSPEGEVELRFDVDGTALHTAARVVWSGRTLAGATVAFRFCALPGREADRLRRFLFRVEAGRARARAW